MDKTRAVMEDATRKILARIRKTGWPIQPGQTPLRWDINHGWCVDWAETVCDGIPGAVIEERDDGDMLHTFVVLDGRYYDAECLGGAGDVTGLPVFMDSPPARPETGSAAKARRQPGPARRPPARFAEPEL